MGGKKRDLFGSSMAWGGEGEKSEKKGEKRGEEKLMRVMSNLLLGIAK